MLTCGGLARGDLKEDVQTLHDRTGFSLQRHFIGRGEGAPMDEWQPKLLTSRVQKLQNCQGGGMGADWSD